MSEYFIFMHQICFFNWTFILKLLQVHIQLLKKKQKPEIPHTIYKIIVQSHNQDMDTDTIYQSDSDFSNFTCCKCVWFYIILSHV